MRLINCITYELEEFIGSNIPNYAILSHTWGPEEVLFSDLPLRQPSTIAKAGYRKIKYTCGQALHDGLAYAWVDTCCIDKTSSAELSEAINSMFYWYSNSTKCYAFLEDVLAGEVEGSLPQSRWFTRGWTLQELIAPTNVFFYDKSWKFFGDRQALAEKISQITRIDLAVLRYGLVNRRNGYMVSYAISLDTLCIARKMSWASSRVTSRQEDVAYCLLGLFNINMPLLYGEGERAFARLQEEIIRRSDSDDSILAWGLNSEATLFSPENLIPVHDGVQMMEQELLARSPKAFENCTDLTLPLASEVSFSLTNTGINLRIPTVYIQVPERRSKHGYCLIGLLSCSAGAAMRSYMLGVILHPLHRDDDQHPLRPVYRGGAHSVSREKPTYKVLNTVFVSTRDAIKRSESSVTIVRMNRRFGTFNESYVINNSKQFFEKLGWRLADVTGWSPVLDFITRENVPRDPKDWDPTTMTYTRLVQESQVDMLSLEFSSEDGPSSSSYTLDIKVENQSRRPEARSEAIFECKDGSHVQLTVNWVDEGTIHQWRVFSINIGIVAVF